MAGDPHRGPREGQGENDPDSRVRAVQMSAVGLEFGASSLGGLFLGYLLDDWLGTGPWGVLVGTLAGFASAVYRTLILLRRFDRIREQRSGRGT